MKTVNAYKAQPVVGAVEPVQILIVRSIPDLPDAPTPPFENVLDEARAIYQKEAGALAEALLTSLPGGTVDALLAEFMRRKVSLFCVPYEVEPRPSDMYRAYQDIISRQKTEIELLRAKVGGF